MKKIIIPIISFLLFVATATSQSNLAGNVNIIPRPDVMKIEKGSFALNNNTPVFVSKNLNEKAAKFFIETLRKQTGYTLPITRTSLQSKSIALILNDNNQHAIGKEGYKLVVTPDKISIIASQPNGLFYGIQSLLQLLPSANTTTNSANKITDIRAVDVTDNPRFEWRSVMLDVSRHFFPKSFVMSLIDQMAAYKFNTFHWHLTDDQGWRIQIKGLPQLTDIGAWRVPRTGGRFGYHEPPKPGEKATYGGFYTQEDIKEVVQYAAERYITIVPEIDIPAHSKALIASFPNLACSKKPAYVNPGSPLTEEEENVLCVANDSTYIMLDKIFTQVAELFPGQYIHLGGDEAFKGFWKNDPKDKKLMEDNNLRNLEELQSFFIQKAAKIINSKGKFVIGWEEIMQGGLTPGTVLQSWTSVDAGIKAAGIGHKVIMSPWDHGLYMDNSPIKRSYSFEPVPKNVDEKFILGGEGCLWTEHVPHQREAERMYWPRLMALSEVFWSDKQNRNYDEFTARLEAHLPRLEAKNIQYSKSIYHPRIIGVKDTVNKTVSIELQTELKDLEVYYTFDGTDPDDHSPIYAGGVLIAPPGATHVKAITYRNGKPVGKEVELAFANIGRRRRAD